MTWTNEAFSATLLDCRWAGVWQRSRRMVDHGSLFITVVGSSTGHASVFTTVRYGERAKRKEAHAMRVP